jgi:hypothetical protein
VTRIMLVSGLLVLSFCPIAAIPSQAQTTGITLGSATGIRGRELRLPVYLTISKDQKLERVVVTIDAPAVLSFVRAEVAKDALPSGVSIVLKEAPAASQSSGNVKRDAITLKAEKENPLPSGLIGSLYFKVDKTAAQQMRSVPVVEAKGFSKGSAGEIKLRGDPGSVVIYESEIEQQPLTGCFFFSH